MNIHHLKIRYSGRTNVLPTAVLIGSAFQPPEPVPRTERFNAIWDTGASASVISQKVVDALGLAPIGMTKVSTATCTEDAEVYLVSLRFPDSIGFSSLRVTKGNLGEHLQVLIGMDVIQHGDFSITNHDGATELNFQIPSQGLSALHAAQKKLVLPSAQPAVVTPPKPASVTKIPRNAPCPCGSGKKYKKCCGAAA